MTGTSKRTAGAFARDVDLPPRQPRGPRRANRVADSLRCFASVDPQTRGSVPDVDRAPAVRRISARGPRGIAGAQAMDLMLVLSASTAADIERLSINSEQITLHR